MLQFTKEVKENWLNNLKSGKYKQGFGELYISNDNTYCCIGVLGHCTEGLTSNENDFNSTDSNNPYGFLHKNIRVEKTNELWKKNDALLYQDDESYPRDYSNVISLIEALPTVD